jgi:ethanolamine utilization protein EutP (predicted NTPase)
MFTRQTIGVVTKIDLLDYDPQNCYAASALVQAGVDKLITTSAFNSLGISELQELLQIGNTD